MSSSGIDVEASIRCALLRYVVWIRDPSFSSSPDDVLLLPIPISFTTGIRTSAVRGIERLDRGARVGLAGPGCPTIGRRSGLNAARLILEFLEELDHPGWVCLGDGLVQERLPDTSR